MRAGGGRLKMKAFFRGLMAALPLMFVPAGFAGSPAMAQFARTAGGQLLEAVRGQKLAEIFEAINKGGATVVNTRDYSTRETPLHIAIKRNEPDDYQIALLLLQKGADPNLRDRDGNTAMMTAVNVGNLEVIPLLLKVKANVNQGNNSGETPLIRAVQRRDLQLVRTLLTAGADPDQADSLAGKSARGYAEEDSRTPALAKIFADIPKRERRAVSGPKL